MANALLYNALMKENEVLREYIDTEEFKKIEAKLTNCPWDPANWNLLPYDNSCYDASREVYVRMPWGTNTQNNCGASCTWTVPAGVNTAMFQVWGSGAMTATGCCCGGSHYGPTGAYAVSILPVTAGESWTLCAGCTTCCWAARGTGPTTSDGSYANNTNGTQCICALGSCSGMGRSAEMLHGEVYCRYRSPDGNRDSGACICNGGHDYCFTNSCATCGLIDFHKDTDRTWKASGMGACTCGLPSFYGKACFDTNHYGYKIHAPVIDVDHTVAPNTCQCCFSYSSGTCCGGSCCSAAGNYRRVYGAGGTATHVMGGGNSNCGDSGRPGMVRVTWWTA